MAAPNADAVAAATEVALAGGNAVDACLAAAVVAMVTEPGVVSPLGGAFVAVDPAGGSPVVVDGNVEMPGRGAARRAVRCRAARGAHAVRRRADDARGPRLGGHARGVRGAGAGARAVRAGAVGARCSRRRRRCAAAATGSAARPAATSRSSARPCSAGTRRPVRPCAVRTATSPAPGTCCWRPTWPTRSTCSPPRGGRRCTPVRWRRCWWPTWRRARGWSPPRTSPRTGRRCVRASRCALGSWTLSTNPPPSIGGPVLATMLRLLADGASLLEVQRAVLGYRAAHLDSADDLSAAGAELLALVDAHGWRGLTGPASTAHVSAVDGDGNACALTCSSGYGSGATVPGTGMLLNNALGEPELNRRGLHALAPGTRLASNMAPTTGPLGRRRRAGRRQPRCRPDHHRAAAGAAARSASTTPGCRRRSTPRGCTCGWRTSRSRSSTRPTWPARPSWPPAPACPAREHPVRHMYFGGVGVALRGRDGGLQAAADPRRAAATGRGVRLGQARAGVRVARSRPRGSR